jgi:hypothetical protein
VHHHAIVSGLQPATTYYYKVGDAVDGYSEVFTFTVAPNYATQSFNVVGLCRVVPDCLVPASSNGDSFVGFRQSLVIWVTVLMATPWKPAPSLIACTLSTIGSCTLAYVVVWGSLGGSSDRL